MIERFLQKEVTLERLLTLCYIDSEGSLAQAASSQNKHQSQYHKQVAEGNFSPIAAAERP